MLKCISAPGMVVASWGSRESKDVLPDSMQELGGQAWFPVFCQYGLVYLCRKQLCMHVTDLVQ